ncbi:MAG: hypothetical protein AB1418_06505 [Pseudomonadota bacterium]
MAGKTLTLSLNELDRLGELLMKARAVANMAGAAKTCELFDDSLSTAMWTVNDFLSEAKKIVDDAVRSPVEPPAEVA